MDAVFAAIRGIEISDFHCGIGEKSYRTSLGWLLKSPEKFLEAVERSNATATAASAVPTMTAEDRAAYLKRLETMPFSAAPDRGVQRNGTGPPRSIGSLLPDIEKISGAA